MAIYTRMEMSALFENFAKRNGVKATTVYMRNGEITPFEGAEAEDEIIFDFGDGVVLKFDLDLLRGFAQKEETGGYFGLNAECEKLRMIVTGNPSPGLLVNWQTFAGVALPPPPPQRGPDDRVSEFHIGPMIMAGLLAGLYRGLKGPYTDGETVKEKGSTYIFRAKLPFAGGFEEQR